MSQASTESPVSTNNGLVVDFKLWLQERGLWWAASVTFHAVVLSAALLLLGNVVDPPIEQEITQLHGGDDSLPPESEVEHFELGETPIEPTDLNTNALTLEAPSVSEQINTTEADQFTEAGGGTGSSTSSFGGGEGFDIKDLGIGPALKGFGGLGGQGVISKSGAGGKGEGFSSRGSGVRKTMLGQGGTRASERAVSSALNWLARHQLPDGRWSLNDYRRTCKDGTCSGPDAYTADSAATAMALLPFLAAGQTHKSKGPYQRQVYAGINWLIQNQDKNGDLSAGAGRKMYSHGLATICLCEAFGLSDDSSTKIAAQRALDFICYAQDSKTGGWRYEVGEAGDTSVTGWQLMALKSGMMAGLHVPPSAIAGTQRFLKSCAQGKDGGLFAYMPDRGATPTMSAVGLLCSQYLGMQRKDPAMIEGIGYLMANPANINQRDIYYWYYATQVMHNIADRNWDTWNRNIRRVLIDSQVREGCAEGSWDPAKPVKDAHGDAGGRVMVTCLSTLTLEVYYRYLPLYKLDSSQDKTPSREGLPTPKDGVPMEDVAAQ